MLFSTVLSALSVAAAIAHGKPTKRNNTPPDYVTPPPGPPGGLGLNTTPHYVYASDFDFQSLNLGLNQEWIELDLFHHALVQFSDKEFDAAGINAEGRYLIQFMAEQEFGHGTLVNTLLQGKGAKPCKYRYPFKTVREFVDFCQKLTTWGEAGVYGFLEHLDSRASAEMLLQSITTEARQQMVFRQFEGLFPMPVHFTTGITQSMQWTLLSPYLESCPAENPRIEWQIFPALNILNNPDATPLVNGSVGNNTYPGISRNRSVPLSSPGRKILLQWELPGKKVSYNNSYVTNTTAGEPKFAAFISQLNVTYVKLQNLNKTARTATITQPAGEVLPGAFGLSDPFPVINGTQFIVVTDTDPVITPFNLSQLNPHVVAGPAMYQSG